MAKLQSGTTIYGNANVQTFLTVGSYVSVVGNVTGNYFIGNGSLLTGIAGGYGNANVANYLPTFSGNLTAGNISASGNVVANAFIATAPGGTLSGSGNIIGGNIFTSGIISATGNVTGNYFIGNGSQLTGIITSVSNVANGGSNLNIGAANANVTVSVSTVGNVAVFTPTGLNIGGIISASGNVLGGNLSTSGNVSGANITASGYATVTGNITAGNISTAGLVTATGNITSGNVLTAGIVSATGNATAGNISTAGLVSATGNLYAGNTLVAGSESVAGNITSSGNINQTGTGNINGYNGYFSNNLTVIGTFQSTANITANGAGIFYGNANNGNNALFAGVPGYTPLGSNVVLQVAGNANSYSQINFQNINNGTQATTEIIVTANNGNDVAFFGDFGIAGNNYSNTSPYNDLGTAVAPNDTYLYAQGNSNGAYGNLIIGSNEKNGVVRVIANGSNTANIVATFANGGVNVTGIVSATGNIAGNYILGNGALLTGVTTSSNSIFNGNSNVVVGANTNITVGVSGVGNVATFTPTGFSVTGNVTGNYFIGNGAFLSGISGGTPTAIINGNSNVNISSSGSNITVGANGVSNVVVIASTGQYITGDVSATGNVTGNFIYGNGYYLTGISGGGGGGSNIANGQSNVNIASANANITLGVSGVGNVAVFTPTGLSVTGNIYGNAFVYSGSGGGVSAPGNIIGGNILTGGYVSATGNVLGSYFIGNGALLTGVTATVGSYANGQSNISIASANANVTVSVSGVGNVAVWTPAGEYITGNISASGNIIGGGVRSTSSASAPSNPSVGDFWYNTSTNTQYRYTFDGTNYYWIDDFGATSATQPLYTGPILFNDVSTQTNGKTGVFALKNNQANVGGVANSKQLQVTLNGAIQTPYVKTWTWPFWCVDVSFKGFKVTTLGYTATANSIVLYRPPAKGTQVTITQVNTATDSQLARYPYSATTIAISDD